MKLKSCTKVFGSIMLFMIAFSTYSQEVKELPPVTVTATSKVAKQVSDAFEKSFKNAVSPSWYRLDKDYFVRFISNDQKNSALFTKKGALIYHISYGYQENLPSDVKVAVESSYSAYNITTAIKIEEGGRMIWVVNLETDKKLVIARFENGELEEVGNYNKS